MSYAFCFGPSGAGKSRFLRRFLIDRAQASLGAGGGDRSKYIMIVPEQYSMQTQRDLVQDHPAGVLMNIDVLSFGRLAHRVFEETGEDRRAVLDDIGKSLLLRRVASRCADDLQILQRGIHTPGIIDEIKSVLSEFMQYGIGTDQIREMADYAQEHGQNALQMRLRDLSVLYEAFRQEKEDRYVTGEETLDLLAKAVPQAKSLRGSVIVFDGFTGFTPVQYRVVMALIRFAKEVVFSFTVSGDSGPDAALTAGGGPAGSEENLFYLSRKTVYDIIRMASKEGLPRGRDIYLPLAAPQTPGSADGTGAFTAGVSCGTGSDSGSTPGTAGLLPRFAGSRVLGHLEQHLFRYPEVPFAEKKEGETERSLAMFTASTPQEEVRQIFAQVRRMIARTGCAYRDFAIVTADLETYGDLFALEAERSGIPVYIDRTSGAFHNILIEGIRSVMQIPVESFSYTSVFRYLRSGLSRLTDEEADLLENYCLANGINSRKKWSTPFDAACEEARIRFLREVEAVTGLVPDERAGNAPAAGRSQDGRREDLQAVRAGSSDSGAGENKKTGRRLARTAAVRTRELYDFLCACGAQARMDDLAEEFRSAGDVVRERQYRQIYRAVIDLLDQIYDLAGDERVSARDYLELLEAGFSQIRLGTIPQRVDRILVGDIERTRLTQIRHLFFAGVNEGSIPRSASRGGILSDMDREFLADGPAVLAPTPRQQMFTQRLYLYLNMTKPSETLTVSFAKTSQDGRSLRPSYLVSFLRGLFPELRVQVPEDRPARVQITSAGDGLHLLAGSLRRFVEGTDLRDPAFREEFGLLYGFFTSPEAAADPQIRACVERLRRAALIYYRPELLRAGLARAVYGDRIVGGISRMETAARCYLMHHLRYGLRLRERDLYEFSRIDGGTILHAALQRFDALLRREGLSWRNFSQEDAQRLSAQALREEAAVYRNLLLYKSARDESRLDRYAKRLLRTVDTLGYQLRKGDFDPVAAELAFGGDEGGMPPIRFDLGEGRQLILVGRIDRVDLYTETAKEDPADSFSAAGRRYLRIMDYKSGFNDLDPGLIRRGLQLQLITYMRALMQAGPAALASLERPGATGEGRPGSGDVREDPENAAGQVIPAAMLYYRIDDPVIRLSAQDALRARGKQAGGEDTEDPALDQIHKKLCPTGLVYADDRSIGHLDRHLSGQSDAIPVGRKRDNSYTAASRLITPEQFEDLSQAASDALCALAGSILDGNAAASPAILKQGIKACEYCPYREACGYDPRIPGYTVRKE